MKNYQRGVLAMGHDVPVVYVQTPWWEKAAIIVGALASLSVLFGRFGRR